MEFSLAMTTTPTREDAEALAERLIINKAAACVQIAEISSIFVWDGKINKDREFLLMIKGRSDLIAQVQEIVLAQHKYDIPELVMLDIVDGSAKYFAWMRQATSE
jgi:periplasmic divalent cation tolerance protein